MCEQFEGIGVTRDELRKGTIVMVAVGRIPALANGQPCVIAPAVVMGPASDADRQVFRDAPEMWWLEVHTARGVCLPQMYRADEILGVPALSLDLTKIRRPG